MYNDIQTHIKYSILYLFHKHQNAIIDFKNHLYYFRIKKEETDQH